MRQEEVGKRRSADQRRRCRSVTVVRRLLPPFVRFLDLATSYRMHVRGRAGARVLS